MRKLIMLVLMGYLVACSGGDEPPKKDGNGKPPAKDAASRDGGKNGKVDAPKLEAATVGSLPGFRAGQVYLAGQPSEDDLKKFADAGGRTVVSLRLPTENTGFDESDAVAKLGMTFHNPGFGKADTLSDPIFWRVRDLLKNKNERPLLLHCASANRVGAIWLAHRVLDDKMSYDDAMKEAQQIGLKPQAYEAVVKAYIETEQNAAPLE